MYINFYLSEKKTNTVRTDDEESTVIFVKKNQYLIVEKTWEPIGRFRKLAYVNRIRKCFFQQCSGGEHGKISFVKDVVVIKLLYDKVSMDILHRQN